LVDQSDPIDYYLKRSRGKREGATATVLTEDGGTGITDVVCLDKYSKYDECGWE
jgi:hypothetical protein